MSIDPAGGVAPRRVDQYAAPSSAALLPSPQTQEFVGKLVVIGSGQPGTGLFIYNGTPGLGNPPVVAAVAPGTTVDPYGNPVSPVFNVGNISAAHAGFDSSGRMYFVDSNDHIRILIDPGVGAELTEILCYNAFGAAITLIDVTDSAIWQYLDTGSASQGALSSSIAAKIVTDPTTGTAGKRGITSYNTAVAGQYVQLDGGQVNINDGTHGNWEIFANASANSLDIVTAGSVAVLHFSDATGYVIASAPGGGIAETWHNFALNTGFAALAGFSTPRYQLEPVMGGRVRLSGVVTLTAAQGAGATIATLPAGYHPSAVKELIAANNLAGAQSSPLQVDTSGHVLLNTTGNNGNFVAFDGVVFELD